MKDGRIYVQGGVANKITVTFPAPVKGIVQEILLIVLETMLKVELLYSPMLIKLCGQALFLLVVTP